MLDMHKKIENLIQGKIEELEKNKIDNVQKLRTYQALQRLINNKYQSFFGKLNINVALAILEDIGVNKEELMETYQQLMKEEIKGKYKLIDINLETDKNNEEEER